MSARKQATVGFVAEATVHEIFERQVRDTPNGIAVRFAGNSTSYSTLNDSSNRIAHALIRSGLKKGQPVAIMLADGPLQIASLLGVFKAGGVIVCLDAEHPSARLQSVLAETKPSLHITDQDRFERCHDLVEPGASSRILVVDEDSVRIAAVMSDSILPVPTDFGFLPTRNPGIAVEPADPVYMVFTSGSTGKPKGIVQSHGSFCQFLAWQSEQFGISAGKRVAQWASVAYDAGYRQIFGTLCFGATLCMAPASDRYNPRTLVDWLISEEVSLLNVVPSFFSEFLQELRERRSKAGELLSALQQMLLTGEVVPVGLAREWFELFDCPPRLWNLYGPSECILATCFEIEAVEAAQHSVPIGHAIDGREILILDEKQRACGAEEVGEIYVRSSYLTLGYFGLPEETASKFVQNPAHDDYPDPVYRTGDLGRVDTAGVIHFHGRKDTQIKLRGMRVELGEIEHALRDIDAINNCAVVVAKSYSKPGNLIAKDRSSRVESAEQQILAAFFTSGDDMAHSELRRQLAEKLPAHMVPQQFRRIPELPVNANHKLDRTALAELAAQPGKRTSNAETARNTKEALLCEIWSEILGIEDIGIHESFFELGGNSLLAMQVLNRVRRYTLERLTFRDLLDNETIAEFAASIPGELAREAGPSVSTATDHEGSEFPLTLSQQGIWFLWRLEPDNPYYTGQGTLHIRGEFDLDAFNRAWKALLDRHDILRVNFGSHNGIPTQTFDRVTAAELDCTDLSRLAEQEQWRTIEEAADRKTVRALDLENDPLFQANLFRLSETNHQVLLTFHEIVLDLWGLSVLIRDFEQLYRAETGADAHTLEPPPISFAEYALAENRSVGRATLSEQKDYWQDKLAGSLPVLELPADRPRPASPTYRGASKSIVLDPIESARLRSLANEHGATVFMTLLAAFNVFLARYTGQDDIIVGAPIANRTQAGAEDLAGFFLNMLPLRSRLDGDPKFSELLSVVRETVTGGICNADYPFMWMLEDLDVQRDLSVTPVFQVMFNMLNLPQTSAGADGLEITYNEIDTPYIKYDLCLYAQEHDEHIYLEFAYLTDLFDASTVERMLANFRTLLDGIVQRPEMPMSQLEMLTEVERRKLLRDFNSTARDFGNEHCIHELFEQQVDRTPNSVAFICGGNEITFAELNRRSNQLANLLRSKGVGRESRVALCVERGIDMAIAMLGVMKSGGTYVALDPDYPLLRLQEILRDTDPAVLVTQEPLDRFDSYDGERILLDGHHAEIAAQADRNLACIGDTRDLLNIVYTSSTTGMPKGVMITIDAVLNRLSWMWEEYPFAPETVAIMQKSYSLVAATWECFGALLKGFPTVIATRDEVLDSSLFWRLLVERKVTHLLASPAVYEGVLSHAESNPEQVSSLRFATTSAEPVSPAMVRRWQSAFPGVPLLNLYGSTECSSNVSAYDTRNLEECAERVPIGKPLSNVNVFVLDKRRALCPIGTKGEMYVSGACLARAYLNNDELNERSFLANPYCEQEGSRLYGTGDLARFRDDGTIELLGRTDRQVNIRGFRVELNDVENAVMQSPAVKRCAVVQRASASGYALLIAYVTAADDLSAKSLRAFLRDRLPDYMVPSDFVFLDSMPLTAAGKVDTRALPEPEQSRITTGVAYAEPSTSTETALAGIWKELLDTDMVGVNDDFFDLGGHSLLATRMLFMVRDLAGNDIPLRSFFEAPTIASLAAQIDMMSYASRDASNDPGGEDREEIVL